ncbi:folate-binding protein [Methylocella sp. CPCC 101449]|uniref:CAF17-like 4Fe-4S cluster assembly/insertion protein YgfZ n=1 Tax=Methylocella sp. CPCC 101449 TaxID=2987531 RepID=UPI00288F6967|nr:folate-binding protein [Methylocella sp. CPCC 101449]MDT2019744.1 folate-binding protein [Methylocella sp. CPCC 101449]
MTNAETDTATQATLLTGRAVLRVTGRDSRDFLNNLVTSDIEKLQPGEGRFAALLTPQGKILFDFFVVPDGDGLLIDCNAAQAADLAKRLGFYKLRADVRIADESAALAVAAWAQEPPPGQALAFRDPRHEGLGWRVIGPPDELDQMGVEAGGEEAYAARRIALGVPEGGADFAYGDAFPHEANMDRLHGVDFRKGCYIGQEVVSRVEHRGTARKRIVRVGFTGSAPARGSDVRIGDIAIGQMGSSSGEQGLALLRLDRLDDAAAPVAADGVTLSVSRDPS